MRHDFPLSKLVVLLCRQLVKPFSGSIINFAKRHRTFRYYGLIQPGRIYHHWATRYKFYLRPDRSKTPMRKIREIDEVAAMEIGTQLMLECLIFFMLAGFLVCEYNRTARKLKIIEANEKHEVEILEERKAEVSRQFERQVALIQELHEKLDDYGKKGVN